MFYNPRAAIFWQGTWVLMAYLIEVSSLWGFMPMGRRREPPLDTSYSRPKNRQIPQDFRDRRETLVVHRYTVRIEYPRKGLCTQSRVIHRLFVQDVYFLCRKEMD